jgi:hypothetical protein
VVLITPPPVDEATWAKEVRTWLLGVGGGRGGSLGGGKLTPAAA